MREGKREAKDKGRGEMRWEGGGNIKRKKRKRREEKSTHVLFPGLCLGLSQLFHSTAIIVQ